MIKKNIIYFLKSKGLFSIWILIVIGIGTLADLLEGHRTPTFSGFIIFLFYYYLFFTLWLAKDLILSYYKKEPLAD